MTHTTILGVNQSHRYEVARTACLFHVTADSMLDACYIEVDADFHKTCITPLKLHKDGSAGPVVSTSAGYSSQILLMSWLLLKDTGMHWN